MEHKAFRRINKDAGTALLCIHGIVGTPNHFAPFVPLVPESVSIYNLLLDGHGKGTADFAHTSMTKWEAQVHDAVCELLSTHEKLYIAAHSMGTLLSIGEAVRNERIAGLFLLAVPMKVGLRTRLFINTAKVFFDKVSPGDPHAVAAQDSYSIARDTNPLHYIGWIPRYLELFAKIRETRDKLHLLSAPTLAYQSRNDEMVSRKAIEYLKQNANISVHELKNSCHFYYDDDDFEFLRSEFESFLSQM